MAAETGEQILRSFLTDDESLHATATVDGVQRGFSATPPRANGTVTVGVTEDRLLWFDDELDELDRTGIESVEGDVVDHQSAPTIVRIGSFVMIAGVVAALFSYVFGGQSLPAALGLAVGGVLAFVATVAVARVREDAGSEFVKHRLTVEGSEETVQLWGDRDELTTLKAVLVEEP